MKRSMKMETIAVFVVAAFVATMAETAIGRACGDKEFEESVRIEKTLWTEKAARK
jgi:hypothetical protein